MNELLRKIQSNMAFNQNSDFSNSNDMQSSNLQAMLQSMMNQNGGNLDEQKLNQLMSMIGAGQQNGGGGQSTGYNTVNINAILQMIHQQYNIGSDQEQLLKTQLAQMNVEQLQELQSIIMSGNQEEGMIMNEDDSPSQSDGYNSKLDMTNAEMAELQNILKAKGYNADPNSPIELEQSQLQELLKIIMLKRQRNSGGDANLPWMDVDHQINGEDENTGTENMDMGQLMKLISSISTDGNAQLKIDPRILKMLMKMSSSNPDSPSGKSNGNEIDLNPDILKYLIEMMKNKPGDTGNDNQNEMNKILQLMQDHTQVNEPMYPKDGSASSNQSPEYLLKLMKMAGKNPKDLDNILKLLIPEPDLNTNNLQDTIQNNPQHLEKLLQYMPHKGQLPDWLRNLLMKLPQKPTGSMSGNYPDFNPHEMGSQKTDANLVETETQGPSMSDLLKLFNKPKQPIGNQPGSIGQQNLPYMNGDGPQPDLSDIWNLLKPFGNTLGHSPKYPNNFPPSDNKPGYPSNVVQQNNNDNNFPDLSSLWNQIINLGIDNGDKSKPYNWPETNTDETPEYPTENTVEYPLMPQYPHEGTTKKPSLSNIFYGLMKPKDKYVPSNYPTGNTKGRNPYMSFYPQEKTTKRPRLSKMFFDLFKPKNKNANGRNPYMPFYQEKTTTKRPSLSEMFFDLFTPKHKGDDNNWLKTESSERPYDTRPDGPRYFVESTTRPSLMIIFSNMWNPKGRPNEKDANLPETQTEDDWYHKRPKYRPNTPKKHNPGENKNPYNRPGHGRNDRPEYNPNEGLEYNTNNGPRYNPNNGPGYISNNHLGYNRNDSPGYNPNNGSGYNPNNGPRYKPNNVPGYIPNNHLGYNSNDSPGYNPNNGPRYIPNNDPRYNPNNGPGYITNSGPRYKPNYRQRYRPNHPPKPKHPFAGQPNNGENIIINPQQVIQLNRTVPSVRLPYKPLILFKPPSKPPGSTNILNGVLRYLIDKNKYEIIDGTTTKQPIIMPLQISEPGTNPFQKIIISPYPSVDPSKRPADVHVYFPHDDDQPIVPPYVTQAIDEKNRPVSPKWQPLINKAVYLAHHLFPNQVADVQFMSNSSGARPISPKWPSLIDKAVDLVHQIFPKQVTDVMFMPRSDNPNNGNLPSIPEMIESFISGSPSNPYPLPKYPGERPPLSRLPSSLRPSMPKILHKNRPSLLNTLMNLLRSESPINDTFDDTPYLLEPWTSSHNKPKRGSLLDNIISLLDSSPPTEDGNKDSVFPRDSEEDPLWPPTSRKPPILALFNASDILWHPLQNTHKNLMDYLQPLLESSMLPSDRKTHLFYDESPQNFPSDNSPVQKPVNPDNRRPSMLRSILEPLLRSSDPNDPHYPSNYSPLDIVFNPDNRRPSMLRSILEPLLRSSDPHAPHYPSNNSPLDKLFNPDNRRPSMLRSILEPLLGSSDPNAPHYPSNNSPLDKLFNPDNRRPSMLRTILEPLLGSSDPNAPHNPSIILHWIYYSIPITDDHLCCDQYWNHFWDLGLNSPHYPSNNSPLDKLFNPDNRRPSMLRSILEPLLGSSDPNAPYYTSNNSPLDILFNPDNRHHLYILFNPDNRRPSMLRSILEPLLGSSDPNAPYYPSNNSPLDILFNPDNRRPSLLRSILEPLLRSSDPNAPHYPSNYSPLNILFNPNNRQPSLLRSILEPLLRSSDPNAPHYPSNNSPLDKLFNPDNRRPSMLRTILEPLLRSSDPNDPHYPSNNSPLDLLFNPDNRRPSMLRTILEPLLRSSDPNDPHYPSNYSPLDILLNPDYRRPSLLRSILEPLLGSSDLNAPHYPSNNFPLDILFNPKNSRPFLLKSILDPFLRSSDPYYPSGNSPLNILFNPDNGRPSFLQSILDPFLRSSDPYFPSGNSPLDILFNPKNRRPSLLKSILDQFLRSSDPYYPSENSPLNILFNPDNGRPSLLKSILDPFLRSSDPYYLSGNSPLDILFNPKNSRPFLLKSILDPFLRFIDPYYSSDNTPLNILFKPNNRRPSLLKSIFDPFLRSSDPYYPSDNSPLNILFNPKNRRPSLLKLILDPFLRSSDSNYSFFDWPDLWNLIPQLDKDPKDKQKPILVYLLGLLKSVFEPLDEEEILNVMKDSESPMNMLGILWPKRLPSKLLPDTVLPTWERLVQLTNFAPTALTGVLSMLSSGSSSTDPWDDTSDKIIFGDKISSYDMTHNPEDRPSFSNLLTSSLLHDDYSPYNLLKEIIPTSSMPENRPSDLIPALLSPLSPLGDLWKPRLDNDLLSILNSSTPSSILDDSPFATKSFIRSILNSSTSVIDDIFGFAVPIDTDSLYYPNKIPGSTTRPSLRRQILSLLGSNPSDDLLTSIVPELTPGSTTRRSLTRQILSLLGSNPLNDPFTSIVPELRPGNTTRPSLTRQILSLLGSNPSDDPLTSIIPELIPGSTTRPSLTRQILSLLGSNPSDDPLTSIVPELTPGSTTRRSLTRQILSLLGSNSSNDPLTSIVPELGIIEDPLRNPINGISNPRKYLRSKERHRILDLLIPEPKDKVTKRILNFFKSSDPEYPSVQTSLPNDPSDIFNGKKDKPDPVFRPGVPTTNSVRHPLLPKYDLDLSNNVGRPSLIREIFSMLYSNPEPGTFLDRMFPLNQGPGYVPTDRSRPSLTAVISSLLGSNPNRNAPSEFVNQLVAELIPETPPLVRPNSWGSYPNNILPQFDPLNPSVSNNERPSTPPDILSSLILGPKRPDNTFSYPSTMERTLLREILKVLDSSGILPNDLLPSRDRNYPTSELNLKGIPGVPNTHKTPSGLRDIFDLLRPLSPDNLERPSTVSNIFTGLNANPNRGNTLYPISDFPRLLQLLKRKIADNPYGQITLEKLSEICNMLLKRNVTPSTIAKLLGQPDKPLQKLRNLLQPLLSPTTKKYYPSIFPSPSELVAQSPGDIDKLVIDLLKSEPEVDLFPSLSGNSKSPFRELKDLFKFYSGDPEQSSSVSETVQQFLAKLTTDPGSLRDDVDIKRDDRLINLIQQLSTMNEPVRQRIYDCLQFKSILSTLVEAENEGINCDLIKLLLKLKFPQLSESEINDMIAQQVSSLMKNGRRHSTAYDHWSMTTKPEDLSMEYKDAIVE
ncbi:hypothetical protein CBL_10656 [Carabus blaptoides fortunei]